jgi:hypothetical protein
MLRFAMLWWPSSIYNEARAVSKERNAMDLPDSLAQDKHGYIHVAG